MVGALSLKIAAVFGIFRFLSITNRVGEVPAHWRVVRLGLSTRAVVVPITMPCS